MTAHHCPSHPCPICFPGYGPNYGYPPHYPTYSAPAPKGCICPPGAEITCQGFGCPRKGVGSGATAIAPIDARSGETPKSGSTRRAKAGKSSNPNQEVQ